MANTDSSNLPIVKADVAPGFTLSAKQRALCEAIVSDNLTWCAGAHKVGIATSTAYDWRDNVSEVRRYLDTLTDAALTEARRRVKTTFAAAADEVAQTAVAKAKGKGRHGKPSHPYQHFYTGMILDRVLGKPGQSQELGVKSEPDGTVTIVWRARD